jgi:type II secretory pathway pseudopilin PulG
MVPSPSSRRAFSFAWFLLIIAIVVILLTLFFPASSGGGSGRLNAVKRMQAKNDATQIATAINAYVSEYDHLPTKARTDVTVSDDGAASEIMDVLCPPNLQSPPAENPKGITFLEIPRATKDGRNGRANGTGPYLDPWGNAYFIALDGDRDGFVWAPAGSAHRARVHKTVAVWSRGDPKREGYDRPEKWIKSWE